jgi:hypothetical protein
MDRQELRRMLGQEGVKDSTYSLAASNFDPDEALCLRQEGHEWVVYYSERGLRTGKRGFPTEAEACLYVLETLRSDPTVKVGWHSGLGASGGA